MEDDFGDFWVGSNHGIHKVSRENLQAAIEGRTNKVHYVSFRESDGLPSGQTASERQPVACKDRDGNLWFATAKGVVAIDPTVIHENSLPPPVLIEQIVANDEIIFGDRVAGLESARTKSPMPSMDDGMAPVPSPIRLRLPPGRARVLEIHYTANTFVASDKVRFQYRLEGQDANWRYDDRNRRTAMYTGLRPRFHVIDRRRFCRNSVAPGYVDQSRHRRR